ncbi:MAG: hypothetical protein L0154_25300 [Chloroflexi bacterium]|nr:hypothetical protein [Chloroflexota bacterium]
MVSKLNNSLRQNAWLLLTAFAAFAGSSYIGSVTVDAGSTTPAIWLAAMWSMLAVGAVIIVLVVIEAVNAMMN